METKAPEEQSVPGNKKQRSPNYPAFGLGEAINKARILWEHERTSPVAAALACEHWGVKSTSSSGMRCVSTMLAFGLVEDEGKGEAKKLKLSERGRALLRHPDAEAPDGSKSPEYMRLRQDAALAPRMHAELWEQYKADGWPSDKNLAWTLEEKYGFHDQAIGSFIAQVKGTFELAGLVPGARMGESKPDGGGRNSEEKPAEQPPPPFKPMSAQGQTEQPKSLPLPLISGGTAVLQLPYLLSDEDFDWLKMMLERLKKGIVAPPSTPGSSDGPGN